MSFKSHTGSRRRTSTPAGAERDDTEEERPPVNNLSGAKGTVSSDQTTVISLRGRTSSAQSLLDHRAGPGGSIRTDHSRTSTAEPDQKQDKHRSRRPEARLGPIQKGSKQPSSLPFEGQHSSKTTSH